MGTPRLAVLMALLALPGGGCYDPRVRARLSCGPHGECPGDQRCVDDVCGGDPGELDGGTSFLDADLIGPYDLTVHLAGSSVGQVRSSIDGIACGADCSETYTRGTQVLLRVVLNNGAGVRFAGWRGDCAGIETECLLTMDGPREVTAEFAPITHNLVFVTRAPISMQLGDATQYDGRCNAAASAAGLNTTSNDGFTAWISDGSSTALQRLNGTGARGFVRMDGLPFTPSLSDLTIGNVVYNPVLYDEGGRKLEELVATGTSPGGAAAEHCGGWTGASGASVTLGRSHNGPVTWTSLSQPGCTTTSARVYCFQHTQSAELDLMSRAGPATRAIFVTRARLSPGSGVIGADELCAREAPVGPTVFKALLPRGGAPASQMLDLGTTYTTMAGQLIGSGRELISNDVLHSGIWQHGDGTFFGDTTANASLVLTGSFSPAQAVVPPCGGLAVSSGLVPVGAATDTTFWWGRASIQVPCSTPLLLYCVQQ